MLRSFFYKKMLVIQKNNKWYSKFIWLDSSVRGTSWYIYYCDFVSYLLKATF